MRTHHFRNEIKDPEAASLLNGDARQFGQDIERRRINTHGLHVGNHQRPFTGLQFGEEHPRVRDDAHAPSLGVQNLLDRTGTLGIAVEDKNADLPRGDSGTSTHSLKYSQKRLDLARDQANAAYR